jgi:uncharacterized RDD family membrane protein YckC
VQPYSAPRYSDDGQWYWDGQRWIPTAPGGALAAGSGLQVQHAGFWLRFVAYLIDGAILLAGQVAISIVLAIAGAALDAATSSISSGSSPARIGSGLTSLLAWVIGLAGQWLYFSLQESSGHQATVGKRVMGIKVVDVEGRRITFGRATARYFSKILSALICDIGFIMAGFTERKQALHDMVAGTLVVRAQPAATRSGAVVAIAALAVVVAVLLFTSIVVVVILATMGGQIQNVYSNVVVALQTPG